MSIALMMPSRRQPNAIAAARRYVGIAPDRAMAIVRPAARICASGSAGLIKLISRSQMILSSEGAMDAQTVSPEQARQLNILAIACQRAQATHKYHKGANRAGWYSFRLCPFCKGLHKAAVHPERGFKCFSCGYHKPDDVAEQLGIMGHERAARQTRQEAPQAPKQWERNPQAWHDRYLGHFDRLRLWQAYKPLTLESISRFQLGVGALPSSPCTHPRLIYANLTTGKPTGFRGRRLSCSCDAKWITAGGSGIWLAGAELLRPGAKVLMVENWIDAILCMQRWPDAVAVASTGGAASWSDAMLDLIIASKPKGVKQWGDNDHAGVPNDETRRYIRDVLNPQRLAAGKPALKPSRWPQYADYLRRGGVHVTTHTWPPGTPYKYDPGSALIDEGLLIGGTA